MLTSLTIMLVSLVALMYAIWSSVFALGKMTLSYSPPLFLTGARMLLGGIVLLSILFAFKRKSFYLSKIQIGSLALLAFFSIYLSNALEFWGQQYLSAAKTCFIYSFSPLFSALFSYLHFGEKMNRGKWLGIGIALIGFIPVLQMQTGSEDLLHAFSFFSFPTLAVMGAALSSVYGWVLLRLVVKNQQISPLMANGMSMLIGGALAFLHSYLVEPWNPLPVSLEHMSPFLKGTILMTFISNIICYNLYGFLLKRFTATFLSFMGLLSPIFASLNAWIILGEPPSWTILLSTAIVCIGLSFVYRAELKQGYIVKTT